MYMKQMLKIGKAENGYIIECRVPIKKKEDKEEMLMEYPGSSEKNFVATDLNAVHVLIKKLMPMLDEEFTSEDEFDSAFESAAKETENTHGSKEY